MASNATIGGATKSDEQPRRANGELERTARMLMHGDKGLLAMDESNPTCNARFAQYGIPQTAEARRAYRELIVTTPGLGNSINGVILYDETIRQQMTDETPFARAIERLGIIPGIKVDTGAKEMAGHANEKVTEGLDGLRARLAEYSKMGARFAKGELASARLNAMNARFRSRLPWALTFSFARAIQQPALEIWRGDEANVAKAQRALSHRARCSSAARRGEYNAAEERASS